MIPLHDHEILLKKLAHYGVDQISLTWFRSYLSDRTQRCYVNGHLSRSRSVKYGVPQGLIIGPLLFLVYINDLSDCLNNGSPRMYTDDTNVSFQSANLNELEEMMTSDLSRLNTWLKANRLSLNLAKIEYMVIGKRQRLATEDVDRISVHVNNTVIKRVQQTKSLGLTTDDSLNVEKSY